MIEGDLLKVHSSCIEHHLGDLWDNNISDHQTNFALTRFGIITLNFHQNPSSLQLLKAFSGNTFFSFKQCLMLFASSHG